MKELKGTENNIYKWVIVYMAKKVFCETDRFANIITIRMHGQWPFWPWKKCSKCFMGDLFLIDQFGYIKNKMNTFQFSWCHRSFDFLFFYLLLLIVHRVLFIFILFHLNLFHIYLTRNYIPSKMLIQCVNLLV